MKTPAGKHSAEIIAHLKETGLDRLTLPDVLEALRQNGIQDLNQLIQSQIDAARHRMERPEELNLYSPLPVTSPEAARTIVHGRPDMPVLVDGVLIDPDDITRYNGQPLHFVASPVSSGKASLVAHTSKEWNQALRTYFQVRNLLTVFDVYPADFGPYEPQPIPPIPPYPQPSPQPPIPPFIPGPGAVPPAPTPPPPPPTEAQFHSDINFKGDWLWLGAHRTWPDLTKVDRAKVLFFSSDWNDVISSLQTWVGTVTLYEHIHQGGSSINFPAGQHIADLRAYGWNDRTSSICNWG